MKTTLAILVVTLSVWSGYGQPTVFPPASQTQVNAGTSANTFVSPKTLAGLGIGPGANSIFVPVMTANTTPYGTAIASSQSSSSYAAWMAFDGDITTYWSPSGAATNEWVEYRGTNVVTATAYTVALGAAKQWTLEGSNDHTNYTALDSENVIGGTFALTNKLPYSVYRLRFADPSDAVVNFQVFGPVPGFQGPQGPAGPSGTTTYATSAGSVQTDLRIEIGTQTNYWSPITGWHTNTSWNAAFQNVLNDAALFANTNANASVPIGCEIDLPPCPMYFTTNIVFTCPPRYNNVLNEPSGFPVSLTFKGQHGLLSQLDWNVASNFCQVRGLLRFTGPTNFNGVPYQSILNLTFEDVGFFSTDCSNAVLHCENYNHVTVTRCYGGELYELSSPAIAWSGFEIGQPSITNAPQLTIIEFETAGDNGAFVENSMFQGGACAIYLGGDHNQVQGCTFGGQGEWMSNGVTKIAGTGLDPNYDERCLGAAVIDAGNDTATVIKTCHFNEATVGIFCYSRELGGGIYSDNYFEGAVVGPVGIVATIISDDLATGFYAKDNLGSGGGIFLANDSPFSFDTNTAPSVCEFSTYDPNLPGVRFMSAAQWNSNHGTPGFHDNESVTIIGNNVSGANLNGSTNLNGALKGLIPLGVNTVITDEVSLFFTNRLYVTNGLIIKITSP